MPRYKSNTVLIAISKTDRGHISSHVAIAIFDCKIDYKFGCNLDQAISFDLRQ